MYSKKRVEPGRSCKDFPARTTWICLLLTYEEILESLKRPKLHLKFYKLENS